MGPNEFPVSRRWVLILIYERLKMFIIGLPVAEWSAGLSVVFLPAIWTRQLVNTISAELIGLLIPFAVIFFTALLVCYAILTSVPLNNLVMQFTLFPQYVKVSLFLVRVSVLFFFCSFFFILCHLAGVVTIYGSCIDCYVTCFWISGCLFLSLPLDVYVCMYVCVYAIGEVSTMNRIFYLLDGENLLESCNPLLWVFCRWIR
jgi:hypothetical protein